MAQRASWFRLLPMRATWRVRSRSASAAAAVQVRVRAMACRSRSDSGTPTAAAFARQSAISAGAARRWICPVRRLAIRRTARGCGGRRPPPAGPSGRRPPGGRGGRSLPLASPNVYTLGRLAHDHQRTLSRLRPRVALSLLDTAGSSCCRSRGPRCILRLRGTERTALAILDGRRGLHRGGDPDGAAVGVARRRGLSDHRGTPQAPRPASLRRSGVCPAGLGPSSPLPRTARQRQGAHSARPISPAAHDEQGGGLPHQPAPPVRPTGPFSGGRSARTTGSV